MNMPGAPYSTQRWPAGTLLYRINGAARTVLITAGTHRHAGPDTVLMRQGEREDHVVLLLRSLVKVTVPTIDGRQALLDVRVSGDLIGEMGVLNDRPRSATVTTCGEAFFNIIRRTELRRLLARYPDIAIQLTGVVADRLRWANRRRIDFASYPVMVRVARVLAELALGYGQLHPDGMEIRIELIQPELATLVGAADISVQRALRELRDAGLVATRYRGYVVRDMVGLRRLADLAADDEER